MDLRPALLDTAARHGLNAAATTRLEHLAGLCTPPTQLLRRLAQGVALVAATLGGLGMVFWIAANWAGLDRSNRFALLQVTLAVMALGAALRPPARVPLSLLTWLATGGLFAYFGQTYQTGADPWQLFALWAALTVPLVVTCRSDALWVPWTLVAMTSVALWVQTHTGHRWRAETEDLAAHTMGWAAALLLTALVSEPLARYTGAGVWARRTALLLTVAGVVSGALGGLFHLHVAPQFFAGLLLMLALTVALASPAGFDLVGLSATGLGVNMLLIAGLAHWLFDLRSDTFIGYLLAIGLIAAVMLAYTVSLILRLSRQRAAALGRGAA
ncbi:MAG TPA: DUF2157 domain-containing protein [Rubrivivax sp.]|nr:DUF2157 domain-containing protein [Rubrivivax sp.]